MGVPRRGAIILSRSKQPKEELVFASYLLCMAEGSTQAKEKRVLSVFMRAGARCPDAFYR